MRWVRRVKSFQSERMHVAQLDVQIAIKLVLAKSGETGDGSQACGGRWTWDCELPAGKFRLKQSERDRIDLRGGQSGLLLRDWQRCVVSVEGCDDVSSRAVVIVKEYRQHGRHQTVYERSDVSLSSSLIRGEEEEFVSYEWAA